MKSRNRCEGKWLFDWLLRALLPDSIGTARLDVRTVAR